MTTSYELSLRLKELGVEQKHGEYYWVKSHGGEIYRVYGATIRLNGCDGSILCRALTLGEVVRMLGNGITMSLVNNEYHFAWHDLSKTSPFFNKAQIPRIISKFNTSPEEAAGELLAELLKQEKQRVC